MIIHIFNLLSCILWRKTEELTFNIKWSIFWACLGKFLLSNLSLFVYQVYEDSLEASLFGSVSFNVAWGSHPFYKWLDFSTKFPFVAINFHPNLISPSPSLFLSLYLNILLFLGVIHWCYQEKIWTRTFLVHCLISWLRFLGMWFGLPNYFPRLETLKL